jgi:hypothetical protein
MLADSRILSPIREAAATGTVHRLGAGGVPLTLEPAAAAYLATLGRPEQDSTLRAYSKVLGRVIGKFGPGASPGELRPEQFAAWFTAQWGSRAPATWNVALAAIRSACAW